MLIQPICTHPARFFCLTIAWQRARLLYVRARELTCQSADLHLYQAAHFIRLRVTVMTAKVSGKTAVRSGRQHKWAELSLRRPPDLSETNLLPHIWLHLLIATDLWPPKRHEGFSCTSFFTFYLLTPNGNSQGKWLFYKKHCCPSWVGISFNPLKRLRLSVTP